MEGDIFLNRVCPVCSNKPPAQATIRSPIRGETLGFNELIPNWNGFFKDKVFFSYSRCDGCGLLYNPIFFDTGQLERLYGQMEHNMAEVPLEALRRTQRGYFEILKKFSPMEGGYLELGPDIGLFIEYCVRDGYFGEYWLFEPNRGVIPALSAVVTGRKTHIIHDMFGFSHVPDHAVSVAVMIQVLDHLVDPVATLREIRQKLAPGARLLIVTHNESSLLRHIVGWRWPAFCLQHPQIYNPETMRALLKAAGFQVLRQCKTVNYFQVGYLLKHLLWAFGMKVQTTPSFSQLTLGLKLGNMLTIATQKVHET